MAKSSTNRSRVMTLADMRRRSADMRKAAEELRVAADQLMEQSRMLTEKAGARKKAQRRWH